MMRLVSILLTFALLYVGTGARAETLQCTELASLPATITAPGHYCLNKNFYQVFTTAAVNIAADNVVLDCNDHVVAQTGANAITGVYANNRKQVTVRNCVLIGFGRGIGFFESAAGLSRGNRILRNTIRRPGVTGVQVAGSTNLVEDNHISCNRGSGSANTTYGILISSVGDAGDGNVVRHNTVAAMSPEYVVDVVGIYLLDVDGTVVIDNSVHGLYSDTNRTRYGLVGSEGAQGSLAVGNRLSGWFLGSSSGDPISPCGPAYNNSLERSDVGIRFDADADPGSHNACVGNLVDGFKAPVLAEGPAGGCVMDGNILYD
jgi:hypothetical protein